MEPLELDFKFKLELKYSNVPVVQIIVSRARLSYPCREEGRRVFPRDYDADFSLQISSLSGRGVVELRVQAAAQWTNWQWHLQYLNTTKC